MKKCRICGELKELSEYPTHDKKKGTFRAQCQLCYNSLRKEKRLNNIEIARKQNRDSYYQHAESRKSKIIEYIKNNPEKHKEWAKKARDKRKRDFLEFKSKLSCVECGEKHISCLDFHHLNPSEKINNINKLRNYSLLLEEELKKCIVLCANCHRKFHWKQNH